MNTLNNLLHVKSVAKSFKGEKMPNSALVSVELKHFPIEKKELTMARPTGSAVDRLPIKKEDYEFLLFKLKKDKQMRADAKQRLLNAFVLLYHTGCRCDEIRNWSELFIASGLSRGRFILRNGETKTGKSRVVLLSKRAIEEIDEKVKPLCGLIFGGKNGEVMSSAALKRLINSYLHKTLGEEYSSHSFRSGAIMRVAKASDMVHAQHFIGHSSVKTTAIYIKPSDKDILEALERI